MRDAVFDQRHVEVDQQANPLGRRDRDRQKLLLWAGAEQLDAYGNTGATVLHRPGAPGIRRRFF